MLVVFSMVACAHSAEDLPAVVQFNRHIRPILSEKCLHCHGPDANSREAELRLDDERDVRADRGGHRVIAPGSPKDSSLFLKITASDEADRMPPTDSDKQLTKNDIELLRRWIEQGAKYEKHWSFIAPKRPSLPKVAQQEWPRNQIDYFVLAKLEQAGLHPSPEATRSTLLRRASLDLTGLPPTLRELDEFLADKSRNAYERAVVRLLNSPRYGEHMARYWLDAARYADTNGFFVDSERSMWRWRDWVINAYNHNMPFDQFTVEQLAGDLLPNPSISQRIATGFNRNHMTTRETGVIDEEYRVEYVVDRLDTTATVWLGLTVGCARCHEHKYDPISQKEFYQLFAFFNNVPETGMKRTYGNSTPILKVPTAEFETRLETLRKKVAVADKQAKALEPELAAAQSAWEKTALKDLPDPTASGLAAHFDMEQIDQAIPFEQKPGLLGSAASFDGDTVIESSANFSFDRSDAFSYGAWVKSTSGAPSCVLSKNDDVNSLRGFDLMLRKGKAVAHLVHKWNSDAIQVMTASSISSNQWQHVMVTYDGSGAASGVNIYLDGQPQPLDIRFDNLRGTIKTDQPLRIGRRSTSAAFKGLIDDVRIYDRELTNEEVHSLATSQLVRALATIPMEKRTANDRRKLRNVFLAEHAPAHFRQANKQVAKLRRQLKDLEGRSQTTMVMQELEKTRDTHVLIRGQYDQHGEKVESGVPASLPNLPDNAPPNRLGLARWLVDPDHPLTARVAVNRLWQQHFGTGIVKTVEDFGSQGEWPSHPDLLDWLSVEFIESGWDVKHMQRLILTSATYRQSSKLAPIIRKMDPENRLFVRGPRFRLDAEVVRDNALAISGLLIERTGGASVKPYQPKGLWESVTYDGDLKYTEDLGEGLYRRSMYTYWKRQSPPPGMLAFDAPTRETCTVLRPRTNTPLQALALLNDTTYVEAARALAQRTMTEVENDAMDRIGFAFRLATSRRPDSDETDLLVGIYKQQLAYFRQDRIAAEKLLRVGESPRDANLDTAEHAAWTTIASMILNLDETVTKN